MRVNNNAHAILSWSCHGHGDNEWFKFYYIILFGNAGTAFITVELNKSLFNFDWTHSHRTWTTAINGGAYWWPIAWKLLIRQNWCAKVPLNIQYLKYIVGLLIVACTKNLFNYMVKRAFWIIVDYCGVRIACVISEWFKYL